MVLQLKEFSRSSVQGETFSRIQLKFSLGKNKTFFKPFPERRVIARAHLNTHVNALRRAIYHTPKHHI